MGRHDGYLHKIELKDRLRQWSVFLGRNHDAGLAVAGHQDPPEVHDVPAWSDRSSAPVLSTPMVVGDRLYVGTYEGYLFCLANLGES